MKSDAVKKKRSSHQNSKLEIGTQVYMPMGIAISIFIALAILLSLSTSPGDTSIHQWANISVILLSVPFFVFSLIFLVLLGVLIFGQAKLIHWLPVQIKKVYVIFLKISLIVWNFSEKITSPFVSIKSKIFGIRKGITR